MANLQSTTIDSNSHFTLPVGTTAQRPASPVAGQMRYNTDIGTIETYNGSSWISALHYEQAEPEIIEYIAGSHTFTVPQHVNELEVLVIGGGGGGGGRSGGGGGAGGLVWSFNYPVRPGDTIPLSVGAPGGGGGNPSPGGTGGNSSFGAITANGGGFGANDGPATGGPGGSGGGAHYDNGGGPASQGGFQPVNARGYGNPGANGTGANSHNSGGGGGAGGYGLPVPTGVAGGAGGDGRYFAQFEYYKNGTAGWFAAGGAGAGHPDNPRSASQGGRGGGGYAPGFTQGAALDAVRNTGSGGAATQQEVAGTGGAGSNGVILIRY